MPKNSEEGMKEFKNEYQYLLHLVSSAVSDLPPKEIPQNLDFRKVVETHFGKLGGSDFVNTSFVDTHFSPFP